MPAHAHPGGKKRGEQILRENQSIHTPPPGRLVFDVVNGSEARRVYVRARDRIVGDGAGNMHGAKKDASFCNYKSVLTAPVGRRTRRREGSQGPCVIPRRPHCN